MDPPRTAAGKSSMAIQTLDSTRLATWPNTRRLDWRTTWRGGSGYIVTVEIQSYHDAWVVLPSGLDRVQRDR